MLLHSRRDIVRARPGEFSQNPVRLLFVCKPEVVEGKVVPVIMTVHQPGESQLPLIAQALHPPGMRLGPRQRRQQQPSQDRDYCDDDEQLNQRKAAPSHGMRIDMFLHIGLLHATKRSNPNEERRKKEQSILRFGSIPKGFARPLRDDSYMVSRLLFLKNGSMWVMVMRNSSKPRSNRRRLQQRRR